ncbi:Ribosomal RNA large subunit methyltransferase G [Pseudooceanicola marinus]|uniref:Ribosomal RNA large subunit methyltransferase G n=1 Tax=Pseudooceanicola marinus TaxID=396013 RepID=A0A1X6ZJE0_9RHOB|nr:methyltransferase [Pseudooceanicola marinus]PJE31515.1 class I SAM-dependent methyltransferase [Pseudooceanicola marinus]SLN52938.1 Ribosomal RNA large subunit methyltransferase G [Pseudooceanicola marinus]
MLGSRLALAMESGPTLPEAGRIAVFAPHAGADLSALPKDRVEVVTGFRPDYTAFERLGYAVAVAPEGRYAAALVCLPRAKAEARALVAQARAVTDGPVLVDGQKDAGVDSMLKALRGLGEVSAPISKAHGKLFWIGAADLEAWRPAAEQSADGWHTAPGVFSADGIDPASALLAEALPELSGYGADLGAGWGFLGAKVLDRSPKVKALDLVEADHAALACARRNVTDPRAGFHWADATAWRPGRMLDFVVMNPPFHRERKADPELGRTFLRAAGAMLAPKGRLYVVANAHLGYEKTLGDLFGHVEVFGGNRSFKLLMAERPTRQGGGGKVGSASGRMGRSI